jgi:hypothetical protein
VHEALTDVLTDTQQVAALVVVGKALLHLNKLQLQHQCLLWL